MSNAYRPRDRLTSEQRQLFESLVTDWASGEPPSAVTSKARRLLLCSEFGFSEAEAYVWSTFDSESLRQAALLTDAEMEGGGVLIRLITEQYSRLEIPQ